MPLKSILESMDTPTSPFVVGQIISYMKTMPKEHEALIMQCAEHLEKSQTLGAVLAVVHALNEREFLLKCHDDDDVIESELPEEIEKLMNSDCALKK